MGLRGAPPPLVQRVYVVNPSWWVTRTAPARLWDTRRREQNAVPWPGLTVVEGPRFYDADGVIEAEWGVVYHGRDVSYREELRFVLHGDEVTMWRTRGVPRGALFTVPTSMIRGLHETLGRLISYHDHRDSDP